MLSSRRAALFLAVALAASACSDSAAVTTTTPPTQATTPPGSTTTALPPATTQPPGTTTTTTTVSAIAGDPGLGDPYFPGLGNGGYDVEHYTIDLAVDPEANVIDGQTTIEAVATETLSAFNLDFAGLGVESVSVDGAPAGFEREGVELTVVPATLLPAGEEFAVAVVYSGTPEPQVFPGLPFPLGWQQSGETTFVVSEPGGAQNWYPANDHPSDKATYTFRLTVPAGMTAAANGILVDRFDGDDATTFVWEMSHPMASYLATAVVGRQAVDVTESSGGVRIRNYFPEGLADGPELFGRTGEMIDFMEGLIAPYPFDAYGVVVAGSFPAALETQSLSVFGTLITSVPRDLVDLVAMHEVSHQWFGDSVSPTSWRDIWLNEGFATYFEALWMEHVDGRDAYDARIGEMHQVASDAMLAPPSDPGPADLFENTVYVRGALVLHALRAEVGDDTFFEILRTYYERFAYGNAATSDFVGVAEEVAGRGLADLFAAWLDGPVVPSLP